MELNFDVRSTYGVDFRFCHRLWRCAAGRPPLASGNESRGHYNAARTSQAIAGSRRWSSPRVISPLMEPDLDFDTTHGADLQFRRRQW